jgi:hypothetical protein
VDVDAVEALYYAKLVKGVGHVVLDFLFVSTSNFFCGGADEKVVSLAQNEDEVVNRVYFPV